MILAFIVYTFIFAVDWERVKNEKNDRLLFIITCITGATLVTIIMHGVKIPSPAEIITMFLDILGLHY